MRKLKLRDSTLEAMTCSSPPDRKWQDLQPHLPDSRTQAHALPPPAVKSETSHGQLNFSPSAWLPGSFPGFCSSAQLLLVCVSASLYNDLTWIKLSLKKKKKIPPQIVILEHRIWTVLFVLGLEFYMPHNGQSAKQTPKRFVFIVTFSTGSEHPLCKIFITV